MAYPVDQKTARFNTNKHDAFGVDTGGRKLPHTGIDFAGSGPVNSVYGGQVIWSGHDPEAGWSIVIREHDGKRRGYAHMAAKPNFVTGQWVGKGDRIGTIGMSGSGAKGAHLHMWEANTDAAAIRILTGYIDYKGGKTTKQWADGMGLNDPMPAIQASLRETENKPELITEEEDVMRVYANTQTNAWAVLTGGKFLPIVGSAGLALCRATGQLNKDGSANPDRLSNAEFNDLQKTYRA